MKKEERDLCSKIRKKTEVFRSWGPQSYNCKDLTPANKLSYKYNLPQSNLQMKAQPRLHYDCSLVRLRSIELS